MATIDTAEAQRAPESSILRPGTIVSKTETIVPLTGEGEAYTETSIGIVERSTLFDLRVTVHRLAVGNSEGLVAALEGLEAESSEEWVVADEPTLEATAKALVGKIALDDLYALLKSASAGSDALVEGGDLTEQGNRLISEYLAAMTK